MKKLLLTSVLLCSSTLFANPVDCSIYLKKADTMIKHAEKTTIFNAMQGYSNMSIMYMKRYKICLRDIQRIGVEASVSSIGDKNILNNKMDIINKKIN